MSKGAVAIRVRQQRAGATARRGFTLIELLVTLAIALLLLVTGVPSFASYLVGHRVSTASRDLMRDLLAARTDAARTGLQVWIEPRDGAWSKGWEVHRGAVALGEPVDRTLVKAAPVVSDALDFTVCSMDAGQVDKIGFAALGELAEPDQGARVILAASIGGIARYREVVIAASGRAETRSVTAEYASTACG